MSGFYWGFWMGAEISAKLIDGSVTMAVVGSGGLLGTFNSAGEECFDLEQNKPKRTKCGESSSVSRLLVRFVAFC